MLFPFLVVLFVSLSVTTAQRLPPTNVAVSQAVSNGPALRVTWTPPTISTNIAHYEVQYGMVVAEVPNYRTPEPVGGPDTTAYTIEGLTAGTTYAVRVRTVYESGRVSDYQSGPIIQKATFAVPSKVDSPPTVTKAVSSGRPALTVSWSAPQSDSSITKYQVQYRKTPSDDDWMSRNVTSISIILTNLDAGTEYAVRVRAVSGAGEGPFSNIRKQTTFNVPNLVSSPTVTKAVSSGRPALTVSWSAPDSDRTITKYELQYRKTPRGDWMSTDVTSTSTTLTNLDTGTGYAVRVRAVSELGEGPFSNVSKQTTFNVPSQVNPPTVTKAVSSGRPALTVSWSAPQSDSSITKYEVQYKKTSSGGWLSRDATSTFTTLPNLDAGTWYTVRVRAVSGIGNGPFSIEKRQTTFNVPSQVTGLRLSVVSGQAAIRVHWNKPSVDGTFIRYDIQYGPSPAQWSNTVSVQEADSLITELTGLGRRSYDVRVLAVSDVGFGLYSTTSTLSTARVPSQVGLLTVTKAVSSGRPALTVSWSAPQSDSTITKYELQYRKTSDSHWMPSRDATSRSTTLAILDAGTEYTVQVRAVSVIGNGQFSMERRQTTFNVPSRVTGVKLSNVSSSSVSVRAAIKVTWTKPSSDRPIIRYHVQYGPSPAHPDRWSNTIPVQRADSLTTTLTGLARRGYDVRVLAVSDVGVGPYSATSTLSTARVPSQVNPPIVTKAVSSGRPALTVSWSAPQSDSSITKYELQYRKTPSGGWIPSRDATSRSTTLTILDAGTEYAVRVKAVSGIGSGIFSEETRLTTWKVPLQVSGLQFSVLQRQGSIRVKWDKPNSDRPIIRYEVEYGVSGARSRSTEMVRGVDPLTIKITGLTRGTRYVVRVRAVSDAGNGPYSAAPDPPIYIPNVPARVSDVRVTAEENGKKIQITVSWTPPQSDRDITHYDVDLKHGAETLRLLNTTNTTAVITVTSGRTYSVKVRAVSAVGPGDWSDTVSIAPPSAPTGVTATSIDTSSVTITWNNDDFKYRIFVSRKGSSERPPQDPVSPPHNITGLDSNTGYTITVEAYGPLGRNQTDVRISTVPEAPPSLNLEVVSSTVIRVTWTALPNADRLPLTYLISYQSEFDSGMEKTSTQPVELTGLHPFSEYTVEVQARNTGGQLGVNVTGKSTTFSAAPSSPPRNVQFIERLTANDSMTISWRMPPKEYRNGIITSYFIIFARGSGEEQQPIENFTKVADNPSFNAPKKLDHTLTNLTPDTLYSIRVAAVTSGGTGVLSDSHQNNTALELYVSMLTTQVSSGTSSAISWTAPQRVKRLSSYKVYYGVYQSDTFMMRTTTETSIQLSNLSPEVPIEVSVKPMARQGTGLGGPVSKIFFTKEGVPTVPVKNVTVMRINSVSLRVSWTPLSLHEARGWPLYTVIVDSTAGRTTRATVTRNTSSSTVDVDGLCPCTLYSVMVQVGTSAGTSADLVSDPVTADPCPTYTAIIVAVLVVIIMLVIAIIITVVAILFLYRARKKSANSFSPSQSESEVEIKGGKGNSVQMMALSSNSEKHGSMGELHNPAQNGNLEPVVTYETVTTSMGAPVDKSDFASHVTMMHKSRDSGFEKEYLSIVNDPEGVEAIAKANKLKNRYINIHTFDHSRVMLNVPDDNGSDYINASYIDGYKRENAYIASQGPTPSTISDFWQMIVDHKAPVIVMLTKVEEKGKKKCEQYWDETLNTKVDKGRGIQVTTVKFTPYADYEVREFQITSSSSPSVQPLKVKHFLYTAWPDHGVPQHPSSLVRFTHKVRRAYQNSAAPIIVHCSAGVGRTGTYLTIDAMMQRIREVDDLNIYEFVVEMRSKRTFMVQNQDQYAFIHDALCDYITCGDTSVAAHELRRVIIEMEATDPKTKKSGFDQQFEFLGSLSKVPFGEDFKFSKKLSISKKNRFKDRFPYSNSHLHVPGKSPSNGSDYINASYVNSYSRKNAFIAAQTPLPSTVADFWELLWQFKPPTVVVLTSADDDKDGADFWPTQEEGVADYGVVKVNHKATMPCSDYDRHTLEVVDKRKDKCTPHTLKLFHFTTWSADSAPHLSSLLDMMGEVEKNHVGSTKSITVACSDGMSRTGVFVSVMNEIERLKTENEVDLFQTIKLARSKRPYFVFTPEQYKLCFDILQAYLDSFDTYANFKVV